MKRLLSALVLSLLFATTVFALPYPDLDTYLWDFEGVYQTHEMGIFNGYEDGTFGGDLSINRAELAKVLVLATGLNENEVNTAVEEYDSSEDDVLSYFSDASDTDSWYFPYVRYMQIQGWVQGYSDGSYQPSNPVTVAEGLKMVTEVLHGTPSLLYDDTEWYDLYVNYLIDISVLTEPSIYSNEDWMILNYNSSQIGYLSDNITRSKIAELLWRLQDMDYEPTMTLQELADAGSIDYQVGSDSVDITSTYYDFSIENVPLGDFDFDKVRIFRMYPSGAHNDYMTSWQFLYPDEENYMGTNDYAVLFGVSVYDPDYFVETYGEDPDLEAYSQLNPVYGDTLTYNVWCTQETPPAFDDMREIVCSGDGPAVNLTFQALDANAEMARFVACLNEQEVTFYGAYWCSHCTDQKELFGDYADDLPYLECYPDDGSEYSSICSDAEIEAFPTWEFSGGLRLLGVQSLETLSEASSCSL